MPSEIGLHNDPTRITREQRRRWMALLCFCNPPPEACLDQLRALSASQWKCLLRWLHLSGLALCFFHRIDELQDRNVLPEFVCAQLQKNLRQNTERTYGMVIESIEIQRELQDACLRYAVLKGLSLSPNSVPGPEFRLQFDLDFLVAEDEMPKAREILERRGYRLYASNGRSWEFKRNEAPGLALKDVYRNTGSWMVELHAEPPVPSRCSPLNRLQWREFYGFNMPVLSPVDLFLGQGMHAYKHACSEFARACFLLEFRRHVLFRLHDLAFWEELELRAGNDRSTQLGLGIVILLISTVMGGFAPVQLTRWTVARLPRAPRLWVEMYGRQVVLGGFPGNKLHLLLRNCLEEEKPSSPSRSPRQVLLPLCMPPPAIRALAREPISVRLRRYRMYFALVASRLRFHIVEGLRYCWESYRWRHAIRSVQ